MKTSDLFPVNENVVTEILKLFDRTEETLMEDVIYLKQWMEGQPHLPEILDEHRIRNFLTLNKCSVEKTKQKIDMYYTIRSLIPDMFEDINPKHPNMEQLLDIIYWTPLPQLTKEMYRVYILKMRNKELIEKLEPHDVCAHVFNMQEIRMTEDYILGDVIIFDMDGFAMSYLIKLTPMVIAKFITIYEKVYSLPLKGVYIINSHPFINTVLTIVKTLLKPKLFQRIYVCEDMKLLHENIPREMLPKDYGGDEKSCEEIQELIKVKLDEYKERFDRLDRTRVDERLRPEKLKNDEILGFHGKFKKLNVD
ncbi:alpha-tocopherol transfer protein-like [Asbolus verrucosus]|uniref:Alpha-tocopherol transfer protein-like n=1 Tax=Asbolus verrucosus TaxID=1661398 RepID=A0A482V9N9_ASBVE|nr:alpha-tocopherol transfer protein-like [Asbolus verrucosus]